MSDYTVVPAQEIKRITASEGTILDVRGQDEHDEQHLLAPHALVPLDRLEPEDFMLRHGLDREAPVYLLCKAGTRARRAADMFVSAGYKNIFVIDGGILACAAAGEPVSGRSSSARPTSRPASPGGCA